MLTLYIRNIKWYKHNTSDYEYIVLINEEQIAGGKIIKHRRKDGWAKLVKRIAEQHIEEKSDG